MFNLSWFLHLRVIFFMLTWIIFESLISFSFLYLFKQNKARNIIYYYCILHKQPFADNPACWTHLNLSEIHPQDFHSSVKLFVMFQTHELHKGWEVMYSSIYPPPPPPPHHYSFFSHRVYVLSHKVVLLLPSNFNQSSHQLHPVFYFPSFIFTLFLYSILSSWNPSTPHCWT